MSYKKSRILYIKRFLETQTDENNPATMSDILSFLVSEGIPASRKSVNQDIEELIASGEDVVCNNGRPIEYFVGSRSFELPELKLLIDAVRASRFIPARKADALIVKISFLASRYQADELRRSLHTNKQMRSAGDKAYITVDLLNTAVNAGKKITCKYFEWGADKKKFYKHRRKDYHLSPYGLMWNNDHYYAVAWSDSHGKIITLRVDRIAAIKLMDEAAVPKPEGFDMAFYAISVFQMYDGPVCEVTLSCENDTMKHIIDQFGEEVNTEILDAGHFAVRASVSVSPTFFAWIFTFGGAMRIIAPDDIVNEYHEAVHRAIME